MSWERLLNSIHSKKTSSREELSSNQASSDPFEQEAMEGWKQIGASDRKAAMKRLDRKFKTSWPFLPMSIAAILLLGSLTYFVWPGAETKISTEQAFVEITDLVEEPTFEESTPIIREQKKENKALQNQQKKTAPIKDNQIALTPKESPVLPEPKFKVDSLPIVDLTKVEAKKPELNLRKQVKEINVYNFNLVDYRVLRGKPTIPTQQLDLTGTSADKESRDQRENETTIRTVDVPYIDYIEKTMDYLNDGSMRKALNRLENVLAVYPDDVNALFYAGFVCFQTGQFEQSIFYLNQLKAINISNFDQERDWYLVKNYLRTKQTVKAKELLKEIAASSSFYAKQAQRELNENPALK